MRRCCERGKVPVAATAAAVGRNSTFLDRNTRTGVQTSSLLALALAA